MSKKCLSNINIHQIRSWFFWDVTQR